MPKSLNRVLGTLLALPVISIAAPDPTLNRQAEGGLGAELQKQLEKQLPPANPLPKVGPIQPSSKPVEKNNNEVRVYVKSYKIEGAFSISEQDIQVVLEPWINKALTLDEIQEAADAVAKLYTDRGLLAQVVLPPQKINEDGVVLLKVMEAKLSGVKVDTGGADIRFSSERIAEYITYGNPIGQRLKMDSVERAILILREVPGVSVTSELEPGDQDGDVSIKLLAAETPYLTGSITGSNYGSASTGHVQGIAGLNLNNFTGVGDLLRVTGIGTDGMSMGMLNYSVPLSPAGWVLGFSSSYMSYKTVGSFAGSAGHSSTYGVNLTYPYIRSQTTNINLVASYDRKLYTNKSLTTDAVVSNYQVGDWTFSVSGNNYDDFMGGGITTGSLGLVLGRWSSNTWDSSITSNYGQNNPFSYSKATYSLIRNQQIVKDETILNVTLNGQFAFNNLDAVEKIYLGGPTGIRAFPTAQGGGDTGAIMNIELQQAVYEKVIGFLFYDVGYVRQYHNKGTYDAVVLPDTTNAGNTYMLSGAGLGAKYAVDKLNLNATMAWPLQKNPLYNYSSAQGTYVRQNNDGKSGHPYFWVSLSYSF